MEKQKLIKGNNDAEIWEQVRADMDDISYPFMYKADIQHNDKSVFLNIETDLGGGFESGFQSTGLTAPIPIRFTTLSSRINEHKDFRFALHDEDFIDKVGKFFGMEDVKTGYLEFDKKLVVKTNDIQRIKEIFADEQTRKLFQSLPGFNLHIAYYDHEDKHSSLELTIDRDITNVDELHKIYDAFVNVMDAFELSHHAA
ncbi:MAG: hypothetical protein ABI402_16525 [Ferruginibacter sp.]